MVFLVIDHPGFVVKEDTEWLELKRVVKYVFESFKVLLFTLTYMSPTPVRVKTWKLIKASYSSQCFSHFYLTRDIKLKSVQEKLVNIPGSLYIQVMNYSVLGLNNELALYLFFSI